MFFLFHLSLIVVALIIKQYENHKYNLTRKKKAKILGKNFYINKNGILVDVNTGEKYNFLQDENGDIRKFNVSTCKYETNYTKQFHKMIESNNRKKAIKNEELFYISDNNMHMLDKCIGCRYKSTIDENEYVKRCINGDIYFLRICDSMFVLDPKISYKSSSMELINYHNSLPEKVRKKIYWNKNMC